MSANAETLLKYYITRKKGDKIEFKHHKAVRFPIVPFITKFSSKDIEHFDFGSFDAYIGHCYRKTIGKTVPDELANEDFKHGLKNFVLQKAATGVNIEAGLELKFADVIKSLFFNGPDLIKYSVDAQAYLYWKKKDSGLTNIADFIYKIFIDEDLAKLWTTNANSPKNALQQLLNRSLPPLIDVKETAPKPDDANDPIYHRFNPDVIALFKQDFKFLHRNEQLFLEDSEAFFKFYYFLYVIQLANTLNKFFGSTEPYRLYFTLETETVSDNRQTIRSGWRVLESRLMNLMSHSVNLDIVNRTLVDQHGDYQQLQEQFAVLTVEEQQEVVDSLQEVIDFYVSVIPLEKSNWEAFPAWFELKLANQASNLAERKVLELFYRIEFQFDQSSRKAKRQSFANWFFAFCKKNFLKNRGRNGYSLNLSHEHLLFLTKLCIGDQKKIRFNELIAEFNRRYIYFDEATLMAIVELYEKINLIEKKSDSGDAQYVRRIQ